MADSFYIKSEPIPSLDDIFSSIPAKTLKLEEPPIPPRQPNFTNTANDCDLNYQQQPQQNSNTNAPYTIMSNSANFASILPENMVVYTQPSDNFMHIQNINYAQNVKIEKTIAHSVIPSSNAVIKPIIKTEPNFPPTAGQPYTVIKPIIATPQSSCSNSSSQSSGYFTTSPSDSSCSPDLQSFEIQNITDHITPQNTSGTVSLQQTSQNSILIPRDPKPTILYQDRQNLEGLLTCDPKQVLRITQSTPPPSVHQPLKLQPFLKTETDSLTQSPSSPTSLTSKKSQKAITEDFLLKKREANRLAAQKCRDKKTQKIKTLEIQVDQLNNQITQLRHNEERQAELLDQIHSLVNSSGTDYVRKSDILELLIS